MQNSKYIDWDVKEMQLQLLRVRARIDKLEKVVYTNYDEEVKKSTFYQNKNKLIAERLEETIIKDVISLKKKGDK